MGVYKTHVARGAEKSTRTGCAAAGMVREDDEIMTDKEERRRRERLERLWKMDKERVERARLAKVGRQRKGVASVIVEGFAQAMRLELTGGAAEMGCGDDGREDVFMMSTW